jgi:hypothetical protein
VSEHAVAQQQTTNTSKRILSNAVSFQRQAVNHDEPTALPELKIDTLSGDFAESRLGFDFSGVPAFTAMAEQARSLLRMQPMVQRFPKEGASGSFSCPTCSEAESEQISMASEPTAEATAPALEATPTPMPSEPTEEPAEEIVTAGELALPGLIVEDSITELSAGQMKKSDFLNQLRAEVCQAIEAALVDMGRMTEDCPYLNYWFDFYGQKKSKHIERAIHRYAPNASNITSATGYISVITRRARQAAETWARTGEITGVPEGVPTTVPGEAPAESGKGAVTASSPVMFKAREGGDKAADDPQAIQAELGDGRPLDSGVRSRMESAFGMDFAYVRTHTDSIASRLSTRFNAPAFTVGDHVAFGAGEYQPGTLLGDALVAHELAHVVQQRGVSDSVASMKSSDSNYTALECDADKAAMGAIASLGDGANSRLKDIAQHAVPRLKSGLSLQRCRRAAPQPSTGPRICVPARPLTWKDFQDTPTGTHSAWTRYDHDIKKEKGQKIIRAVFDYVGSWVKQEFKYPTDRKKTNCGKNIADCEKFLKAAAAKGYVGSTYSLQNPGKCAASITPDPSVVATTPAECTSKLGPECDRVAVAESARLLRHEQLHFSIGCVLAEKGTDYLKKNPTANAQTVLNAVIQKSNQLSIGGSTNLYDTQTNHGCNAAAQATWEQKVSKGLPTVKIP